MTFNNYSKAKEKLFSISELQPPKKQISKYLKLRYRSLCDELICLSKQEILIDRIIYYIFRKRISKSQIEQSLLYEEK